MKLEIVVVGFCRYCDEYVEGRPVLPGPRYDDLIVTEEGGVRRAHWLKPAKEDAVSPEMAVAA
jgi:hypothetical protein